MTTYLDRIIAAHRRVSECDRRDVEELVDLALRSAPARDFSGRVRDGSIGIIAEIKRRSPSRGLLAADLDPASLAHAYSLGGACCISVLTDEEFFGGSSADLMEARSSCVAPVLRKDFTVSKADVCDARIMGADAVLLIVAALGSDELIELMKLASQIGIHALVEVHDEIEARVALDAGAELIGINQRDLYSFEVDTARAEKVASAIPSQVARVAESGVWDRHDIVRLENAGFDAVLIGEALVKASDPVATLGRLLGDAHA